MDSCAALQYELMMWFPMKRIILSVSARNTWGFFSLRFVNSVSIIMGELPNPNAACKGDGKILVPCYQPPTSTSVPQTANMGKQLWNTLLRVDDEAEQSIVFKHRKWEIPITAKVCAANC